MSGVEFDVVDIGEADAVAVGEQAPDFTRPLVNSEFWEDVSLSDLTSEGPVVLVFTSMDGAFPSTYAWNEIRERGWGTEDGPGPEATIVGLSISSPYEHKTTIEDRDIDYRLFSDPANEVAKTYGIVNDLDGMAGVTEPRPAVFVIDSEGIVQFSWVASEWPEFPDYDEIETAIEAL